MPCNALAEEMQGAEKIQHPISNKLQIICFAHPVMSSKLADRHSRTHVHQQHNLVCPSTHDPSVVMGTVTTETASWHKTKSAFPFNAKIGLHFHYKTVVLRCKTEAVIQMNFFTSLTLPINIAYALASSTSCPGPLYVLIQSPL